MELQLLFRQEMGLTQSVGIQERTGAEFQGLETLVCIRDVFAHQDDAVVLHDDRLVLGVLAEFGGDLLTQRLAAGNIVGGKSDRTADIAGLRQDARVRNLMDDGESHQSRRMGVDDGMEPGAHLVEGPVERIFGRGAVGSDDGAVGLDAHDVGGGQRTLVDTRRRNPHVSVIVHDGQVATGGGRHAAAVDAADDQGDLLGGMHHFRVQLLHF